jgi:LPXTG-motif cell wall-anchored protein
MNTSRLLGLIILVIGLVLLGFGWNASHAVTERVMENMTGRYTENTMWYIISGIAMTIGGGALFLLGGKKE